MASADWKYGMCDCYKLMPLFLVSLLCPCITQGISAWEMNNEGGCGECLIACCCFTIGMSLNREKIRSSFKIKGNCIADCLIFSCCCYACLVTQEYLHITRVQKGINK